MDLELVATACALIVVYALIANRFLAFGRTLRERAVELGAVIVEDIRVSRARKEEVRALVPTLIYRRTAWFIALAATAAFVRMLMRGRQTNGYAFEGIPLDQHRNWAQFNSVSVQAALMNSPIAATLFVIQILIFSFFVSFAMLADVLLLATVERRSQRGSPGDRAAA